MQHKMILLDYVGNDITVVVVGRPSRYLHITVNKMADGIVPLGSDQLRRGDIHEQSPAKYGESRPRAWWGRGEDLQH